MWTPPWCKQDSEQLGLRSSRSWKGSGWRLTPDWRMIAMCGFLTGLSGLVAWALLHALAAMLLALPAPGAGGGHRLPCW